MRVSDFESELKRLTAQERVMVREPMSRHITFRVGGPADYFVIVNSGEEIQAVTRFCEENGIVCYILGNGSNVLIGDKGYHGVIIQVKQGMNRITAEGAKLRVQAGALLSQIAAAALDNGLTGFEFAAGIPGTLGGACVMNAGAYGGEMKDVLEQVTVLDENRDLRTLSVDEMELGYRTSVVAKEGYIVIEAVIALQKGDPNMIQSRMEELRRKRLEKQPLEFPSAGSTFKRPEGYFAGKLIQDAGLRGFRVGGAQVSEKHCGFVINRENATAAEIVELMRQVRTKVREQFDVELEPEVKQIGEF